MKCFTDKLIIIMGLLFLISDIADTGISMRQKRKKVALIFNANKAYDRGVICGIGEYFQSSHCDWEIYIEEDFSSHDRAISADRYDGIIADFDNPGMMEKLKHTQAAIVGLGGSYLTEEDYPPIPYVATDNQQLVEAALNHLRSKGLEYFAFYGFPEGEFWRWSKVREQAFLDYLNKEQLAGSVYNGFEPFEQNWNQIAAGLETWLRQLPKPAGILVATDARARHLLMVCEHIGVMVPEQVAVIGIDNEELTRYLSRISLSSVEQGTKAMGYEAAKMMNQLLAGNLTSPRRIMVPPVTVHARESSDYRSLKDPLVMQAMSFIRSHACHSIKVEDVLLHLGVSRTNIENKFRQETGQTIHQAIFDFKLAKAKKLLAETHFDMKNIADQCGYPSVQYLYAIFKRIFNMTPLQYRDAWRADFAAGCGAMEAEWV